MSTEREIGKRLLEWETGRLDSVASPDPGEITRRVLRRDRRLVAGMSVATAVLWLIATASVIALGYFYFELVLARAHQWNLGMDDLENATAAERDEWAQRTYVLLRQVDSVVMLWTQATGATFGLAALATVVLVLGSRRATLRRVNASLIEIAMELRGLRESGSRLER